MPKKALCFVYEEDDEAYDIWVKIVALTQPHGSTRKKITSGARPGPCGPCSKYILTEGKKAVAHPIVRQAVTVDRFVEVESCFFTV